MQQQMQTEERKQQQQQREDGDEEDYYRIWEWDCVDLFVYFSHHLVTVPPCTWSNACHANGTMVRSCVCFSKRWTQTQ